MESIVAWRALRCLRTFETKNNQMKDKDRLYLASEHGSGHDEKTGDNRKCLVALPGIEPGFED